MERKRPKESYVFEKGIENIMAWKLQLHTLLDTENLQVNLISKHGGNYIHSLSNILPILAKHRENIDTRAIFPLISRYNGALPLIPPAITFCKTAKRLSHKQCNKKESADKQFFNVLTVRKF